MRAVEDYALVRGWASSVRARRMLQEYHGLAPVGIYFLTGNSSNNDTTEADAARAKA